MAKRTAPTQHRSTAPDAVRETLRRRVETLEGIERILRAALASGPQPPLERTCLAVALAASGAVRGFVGRRGDAIAAPGEPPDAARIDRLYAQVLADGRTLIANDAGVDTPLASFMGVPLRHDGETIGMIALGDRPGGFRPADAAAVEALAPAIADALLHRRRQDARAAAHRALVRSEALLRQFAEHSRNILWIVDPATRIVEYRSAAYERIWGEPTADAPFSVDAWLARIHPADRRKVEAWQAAVLRGETGQVDYRIRRISDGRTRWMRDTAFPIRDERGVIVRAGGIGEDMTREDLVHVYLVGAADAEARRLAKLLRGTDCRVRTFPDVAGFLDVAAVLAPGCVVADLRPGRRAALRIPGELRALSVTLPVVLIGRATARIEQVVDAMKSGAADYLTEPLTDGALHAAIVEAVGSAHAADAPEDEDAALARVARLTPRERDVLHGLVAGGTNKVIAQDLGISPRTVELHRAQLMGRLGTASLIELLQLALRAGITAATPDPARKAGHSP